MHSTRKRAGVRAPVLGAAVVTLVLAATALTGSLRPAGAATAPQVTDTVTKGLKFLTEDVVSFDRRVRCQACHRQGAALFGISNSKSAGYTIDDTDASGVGFVATNMAIRDQRANGLWDWGGNNEQDSWTFFGLSEYDRSVNTRYSGDLLQAAVAIVNKPSWQQPGDGSWTNDWTSFPLDYGPVQTTSRFMVGLSRAEQSGSPAQAVQFRNRLNSAINFMRNAFNSNDGLRGAQYNFQAAYALIGLKAAGVPNSDPIIQAYVARLLGRVSGPTGRAWGYTANHGADELNTGLVLFALCKSGVELRSNAAVANAVDWLVGRAQSIDATRVFWVSRTNDVYTTFAILGLSCFGQLGVALDYAGPDRQEVRSNDPNPQTVTFNFTVANEGSFEVTDTYNLSVQGGLPGWTTSVMPNRVTLDSGDSTSFTVSVTAPPNLPEAFPVEMNVVATSTTDPRVSTSKRIITFTDPPPPVSGLSTTTTITAGAGATVTSRRNPVTLSATVRDQNGAAVIGPGKGVVTFSVAGIAVGTDRDADGDGVFSIQWTPGSAWASLGVQSLRAVYSGIDLPGPVDLLGSVANATINLNLPLNSPPEANAGPDQVVEATGPSTSVSLNGGGSTDPDEDALIYVWTLGGNMVAQGVQTSVSLPVGVHNLVLTVTDPDGESSSDGVQITVRDTTAPQFTAPAGRSANTDPGACTAMVDLGQPVGTDLVDGSINAVGVRSDGQPLGAAYPVGVTTITWTVTDAAGNSSSGVQTVTITDAEAPSVTPPAGVTVANDPGLCSAVTGVGSAAAADNCRVAGVSGVRSDGKGLGDAYPVGVTTITWTATDDAGNSSSAAQTVTVNDTERPSITAPASVSVGNDAGRCDASAASAAPGTAAAADNCRVAGVVGVRSDGKGLGDAYPVGVTTITWTATDEAGNSSSATQTVEVKDVEAASITGAAADPSEIWPPNHKMVDVNVSYALSDNCDSSVASSLSVTSNEPVNGLGDGDTAPDWEIVGPHLVRLRAERSGGGTGRIYTITITAVDDAGNTSSTTVQVKVPHSKGRAR